MSLLKLFTVVGVLLAFLATPGYSFSSQRLVVSNIASSTTQYNVVSRNHKFMLFSTEGNETPEASSEVVEPAPQTAVTPSEPEGTQYPINAPSPILLALSMVLAIVGTGSAFELGNPDPIFGFPMTAGLALVTIPSCLFLFYASVLKATAETEADDKEFMKGRY